MFLQIASEEAQYLELSPSPSTGVEVLPTISKPKAQDFQEKVAQPLEQHAALVSPNIVSDAGGIDSQADTTDFSLQSPSHKSGSTSISFMPVFMPVCSATTSPVEVASEDSNKLIQAFL